jgi:hypothetical protein
VATSIIPFTHPSSHALPYILFTGTGGFLKGLGQQMDIFLKASNIKSVVSVHVQMEFRFLNAFSENTY